jgi:hypothetical protein
MSKCHAVIFVMLAGCAESWAPVAEPSAVREESAHEVLRVKEDRARGRRWELGWGAAYVYDVASGQLVRRIPLPRASFAAAREACLPDMLLSRSGALIVSSNANPALWRISPTRFEVELFDIAVDSNKDNDFGFSGLAWDVDEKVLYAASAVMGTLWRIDLESAAASKIVLSSSIPGACGLAVKARSGPGNPSTILVVAIESRGAVQRISLAPGQATGHVTNLPQIDKE